MRSTIAESAAQGTMEIASKRFGRAIDAARAISHRPVALAWSRFDANARARVCRRYLAAIAPWRRERRYAVPGEFVVVTATRPADD